MTATSCSTPSSDRHATGGGRLPGLPPRMSASHRSRRFRLARYSSSLWNWASRACSSRRLSSSCSSVCWGSADGAAKGLPLLSAGSGEGRRRPALARSTCRRWPRKVRPARPTFVGLWHQRWLLVSCSRSRWAASSGSSPRSGRAKVQRGKRVWGNWAGRGLAPHSRCCSPRPPSAPKNSSSCSRS